MATKAALKAAKACLDSKDWEGAANNFRKALSFDPQNYTAHLYLGLALFKNGSLEESKESYNNALSVDPKYAKQREPWQGLLDIHEAQKHVHNYIEVAKKLSIILRDGDDRTRCAGVVNKMIPFIKEHGTSQQYKQCLEFILPGSPVFDFLEGLVTRPADTYLTLAEMTEREEKERINKEIANRRSRLSATQGNVTLEAKFEVLKTSPLEDLYQKILDWSDSEELRRDIEGRLLQHGYDKLLVLPSDKKTEQIEKVRKWAEGIVILKYPFELAWRLFIEWKDCESLAEHDVNILREYVEFFPDTGLGETLGAYLQSEISPFEPPVVVEDEKDEKDDVGATMDEIDSVEILSAITGGSAKDPKSTVCHRILGEYCLFVNDYETAVETCRAGRKLVLVQSRDSGVVVQKNLDAITATLATSLIHYQSPKYHDEARQFFDAILKRNKRNITALVGLGLILEEQQDYEGALRCLSKALELNPDSAKILSEASWCRVLMQDYEEGREGLEKCLEQITGDDAQSRELKAQILWRIGTCIWNADEETRSDRKGAYAYFMKALQSNNNFAPAYTSIGIYYSDIANDVVRATKCFEKAFELSAGEIEAAERLARMFADAQEWDLVEIISRRVADADKKRSVPGKTMSWPQNAIGVVELNAQNHTKAIVAFQTAIRSNPIDFHSWVGLGEAYSNSGKYIAALKTFQRAAELDAENWFVKYMISNVHRELGEFDEACSGYREVIQKQPGEFGVLMALAECLLAMAHSYVEKGYYGQATEALLESLKTSDEVVALRADAFNVWKNIGDVCLLFSWIQTYSSRLPVQLVKKMILADIDKKHLDIISEYDNVGSSTLDSLSEEDANVQSSLYLCILSYKRSLYVSAEDRYAHAVAWFNLGSAELRAYTCGIAQKKAHHKSAIRCFKRAIKLEPGNHEFWNALGVTTADVNPRASQHALVRSLYINEKNARVWTNLGTLYLLQNDINLASEAFTRAQSVDPEYGYAWIGQGLVSVMAGEFNAAQELFEHAFEISDGFATLAKREFATSSFDTEISVQEEATFGSLIGPIFALHKFEQQLVNQPALLHLSALLQERIGEYTKGAASLLTVGEIYEQRYEETDAEEDLIKYAQSKADLARMKLGQKDYDEAIEHASMALDLSADIEELKSCRLSAHLTCGLAHYYNGDMSESLEMFKIALEESSENPDVVALLAQVLWAKGGDDEKEAAREQLFACIENHPDHLPSMLLLGSIGVLDKNEDILEAVMDDLYSVRGNNLDINLKDKVDNLLTVVSQLQNNDPIPTAVTSVFLRPAHPGPWLNLAEAANDQYAADMAKKVSERGDFSAEIVADALAGVGKISCDQRAIMIAPWRVNGWKGLARDVDTLAAGN